MLLLLAAAPTRLTIAGRVIELASSWLARLLGHRITAAARAFALAVTAAVGNS